MGRRLFTLLSVVSLLLLIAGCVAWARGRYAEDRFSWLWDGERYSVGVDAGAVTAYGPPAGPATADVRHELEALASALADDHGMVAIAHEREDRTVRDVHERAGRFHDVQAERSRARQRSL